MSRKKKSYNPLKMWGSWGGGIALMIYSFFAFQYFLFDFWDILIKLTGQIFFPTLTLGLTIFVHSILGFLVGWGIHSLFRRLR